LSHQHFLLLILVFLLLLAGFSTDALKAGVPSCRKHS
jgi:hypothetical protein